jgi:hypothetical protein
MDPFDIIERDTPYLETFGVPRKNFFKIMNWHFQKNQQIPDIREKIGQDLILERLRLQEQQTGMKPFLFLDNLRSLSNYNENESDSWRPIGLWLRDLRGHGYSSVVVDHTGHLIKQEDLNLMKLLIMLLNMIFKVIGVLVNLQKLNKMKN